MRDSHKLKEKYELSLDNSQVVTLTVASLVVLGGVFVLGVVVGKKLALEHAAKPTTDLLTAADEKTAALEHVEKAPALTFQDELTKKAPVVPPEPVAPPPAPAPIAKVAEEPKVAAPTPPAGAVAEPPAPKPAHAELLAEVKKDEQRRAAEKEPALPETVREEPIATRTKDAGALRDAFGKAAQKATDAAGEWTWTLQLSAYQDRAEADRFAAGLRDKGYSPFVVEAVVPGKGTWYRVRLGKFGSKDAASSYLSDFKRETAMNGMVTPR